MHLLTYTGLVVCVKLEASVTGALYSDASICATVLTGVVCFTSTSVNLITNKLLIICNSKLVHEYYPKCKKTNFIILISMLTCIVNSMNLG